MRAFQHVLTARVLACLDCVPARVDCVLACLDCVPARADCMLANRCFRAPQRPGHGCPTQAHTCPTQAHTCPAQAHTCPTLAHTCPTQAHTCPAQAHTCPAQAHNLPCTGAQPALHRRTPALHRRTPALHRRTLALVPKSPQQGSHLPNESSPAFAICGRPSELPRHCCRPWTSLPAPRRCIAFLPSRKMLHTYFVPHQQPREVSTLKPPSEPSPPHLTQRQLASLTKVAGVAMTMCGWYMSTRTAPLSSNPPHTHRYTPC
eukprot:355167-Chlamydomonas_euryale.AAC.1